MLEIPNWMNIGLRNKLSPLEFKVYYFIKIHNIKNNRMLAKLLDTTPKTISVIKCRLVKKGVLTPEEVRERKYTRRKANEIKTEKEEKKTIKKKRPKEDIFDLF